MDQHSNQCLSISFITGDSKLLEVFVTLPAIRTGFTEECKRSRISLTAASRELKSLTYGSAVGITLKPKSKRRKSMEGRSIKLMCQRIPLVGA